MSRTQHLVQLTPDQRHTLETFVASGTAPARAYTRAHILLLADRTRGPRRYDAQIAASLGCAARTVARTRAAWSERGLDAVQHRPRLVNTPPKLDDEQVSRLIAIATSAPPEGHVRWTLRLLATRAVELEITDTLSAETVRTTLKKTGFAHG
jgi:transposase